MSKDIVVTGATGFVGSALCAALGRRGYRVRPTVRSGAPGAGAITVGDIGPTTDWSPAVSGADVVIHCAARVHMMTDKEADPLRAYREVNTEGTLNLARQAAAAGVRRMIFLSSIKVNGEETAAGAAFTPDDAPNPIGPYGVSKAEAEAGLRSMGASSDMEWVILRPPLVYGPGVRANFASMMRWVARGVPLPFGAAVHNRRSLVGLDNLVDLLATCVRHPAAANQVFLASDGEDLSTEGLLRRLGKAMGRPARLVPVPTGLIAGAARLARREEVAKRLLGNLQIDIDKTRHLLDWQPPFSVDEELRRAAAGITR